MRTQGGWLHVEPDLGQGMAAKERRSTAIVLAAGKGTRMRSARPKVLHEIAHRPMLMHVVGAARGAGCDSIAVVVGHGADEVRSHVSGTPDIETFRQDEQLGTAHAVLAASPALSRGHDDILVLFGDTPLLTEATLRNVRDRLAEPGVAVVVVGFRSPPPNGYGRLILRGGALEAIREAKDATEDELAIELCNGGIMALAGDTALVLLQAIGNDNAKGEYYLTDVVELAARRGLRAVVHIADATEVLGVNDRVELADAEALWQARRRRELLRQGVTIQAPDTVHLSADTVIEPDAAVEPFVVFGPGVIVRSRATILAHSHVEGAVIERGATVGPFARLRPGTSVGTGAKVGNFCELKKARLEDGAKVNHLSYVGDAEIGRGANIGAGTITCNYDGFGKHLTRIGEECFVGSNSSLVAPVSLGPSSYVASGSVVTSDVPADALAFGRARQVTREGAAARVRAQAKAAKDARASEGKD